MKNLKLNKTEGVTNLLFVGVGGQGILLFTNIVSQLLIEQGLDVKVSEIHGMAQRGGSVYTMLRYGLKVYSPVISEGEADLVLSFELLEALRWLEYLSLRGIMVVNTQKINPLSVGMGWKQYPEVLPILKKNCSRLKVVNGVSLAKEAGSLRTVNVVMLGVLASLLPYPVELWEHVISQKVPAKTIESNLKAFRLGWGSRA